MGRLMRRLACVCCAGLLLLALVHCGSGGSPPPPPPAALQFLTTSLPDAIVGTAYTATLQATGGTAPYTWTAVGLPAELSLNSTTGTITGTFATQGPGQYYLTFTVTDSAATRHSVSTNLTITVRRALSIEGNLDGGHLSFPYSDYVYTSTYNPATWTVSAGTLPPGLTLRPSNETVVVEGTPSQAGSFTFTLRAQENVQSNPQTATRDFTLVVDTALKIVTSQLKRGMGGFFYSDTVHAVNGVQPLAWRASNLPTGLIINAATGEISGTPAGSGQSAWITVTDASSPPQTDTRYVDLPILDKLGIINRLIWFVGVSPGQFSASGGLYPYSWQVSGNLPLGVQVNSNGSLTGTPTQVGRYPVAATVTDSQTPPQRASRLVTIEVVPYTLNVSYCGDTTLDLGQQYQRVLTAYGGTQPYTWRIRAGALPDGITLDPATGTLSGAALAAGWFTFVPDVTDASDPHKQVSQLCHIDVRSPAPIAPPGRNDSIAAATPVGNLYGAVASISPYADPVSTVNPDSDFYLITAVPGRVVSVGIAPNGTDSLDPVLEILDQNGARFTTCRNIGTSDGLAPDTVDPTPNAFDDVCVNDDIELGVNLSSYLDFQVPGTGNDPIPVYLHVLDERGDARPDLRYTINISGAIDPLGVTTRHLSDFVVGTNADSVYTAIAAQGGTPPYSFALASGSAPLPPGLSIQSDGRISGVATTAGKYTFTAAVTDSASNPRTATGDVTVWVGEAMSLVVPDPLPAATTGVPYVQEVQVTGGLELWLGFSPSPWTLEFNSQAFAFSGVPGTPGTFTGQLSARSSRASSTRSITLTVVPGPLSIAEQPLPDAASGGAGYSAVLTAIGGTPPFTWGVVAGSLPDGLVLDAARGEILGRPATPGTYTFTIQVADAGTPQQTATRAFTLIVTP